jgi:hypothetical protein
MGQAERMPRLNESEYRATMDPQPVAIGQDDEPPFDFWPVLDLPRRQVYGHHVLDLGRLYGLI